MAVAGAGAEIMAKSEPEPKISNFGSATLILCIFFGSSSTPNKRPAPQHWVQITVPVPVLWLAVCFQSLYTTVADSFKVIGTSGNIVTAIAHEKNRLYGFQFHPEVAQCLLVFPLKKSSRSTFYIICYYTSWRACYEHIM